MSEIKDLIDFTYKYPDEEAANAFYIQKRWGKRFYCPHCGADKANIKTIKKKTEEHFYCSKCRKSFSVRTGSFLAKSRISLQKWLLAEYSLSQNKNIMKKDLGLILDMTPKRASQMASIIALASEDAYLGCVLKPKTL